MKKANFSKDCKADNLFVKQIRITPEPRIADRRKELAEHSFGTSKRTMDASYVWIRSLPNVTGEFSPTFLAYNRKRAINISGVKSMAEAIKSSQLRYALAENLPF